MGNPLYNPIRSVDGTPVPCPSSFEYILEDVSASDAGRTADTNMQKMRLGQLVGINLAWQNVSEEVAAIVLRAFNPEYIEVEYKDAMVGGYATQEFYVGNRSAPMYNSAMGLWSNISFNIRVRKAKIFNHTRLEWEDLVNSGDYNG